MQEAEIEESTEEIPEKTEEEILAERRARRAAIKAKYTGSRGSLVADTEPATPNAGSGPSSVVLPTPTLSTTVSANGTPSGVVNDALARVSLLGDQDASVASAVTPQRVSASPPPDSAAHPDHTFGFELAKNGDNDSDKNRLIANTDAPSGVAVTGEQISAADYDPSLDRREDERRRFGVENGKAWPSADITDVDMENGCEDDEVDDTEEQTDEEDLDDMFAVVFDDEKPKSKKKTKANRKANRSKNRNTDTQVAPATNVVVDAAADPEGYYQIVLGERLDNGRYQVFSILGKGMFAIVVRARVLKDESGRNIDTDGGSESQKEVAIKIIRSQDSMYKAGLKEAQILQKLRALDQEDKKHLVKLERTFEHRGHLCLVFESMSMNLREVVKRFGKDVGLNIRAVRAYAHQLFLALTLLKKANVMHADIKPDNILVNEQKNLLKLCDLGSASDASENDITPYLVSRFYRAPEIILGIPYDPALDVWSIGCTLYELYTGKILFPGRSNNHMLLLMMELKGRFNSKTLKRAKFGETYFDELGAFESIERDRITGNDVSRKVHIQKPSRDLRSRLMPPSSVKLKDEENKILLNFVDLLDKCLTLDPTRRIGPKEALAHPFIRG
ncbi:kinase-like protein [Coprinopsis marcescibilis]|uniref:non-specific serine/threonine protein kinase n=1 Tax=Coprinopsis marcescibilis TaxID=230819 RepID=A0A5C3KVC4_COPMA|nr:kinase-like protein [Coprinopsis marcescibilis]